MAAGGRRRPLVSQQAVRLSESFGYLRRQSTTLSADMQKNKNNQSTHRAVGHYRPERSHVRKMTFIIMTHGRLCVCVLCECCVNVVCMCECACISQDMLSTLGCDGVNSVLSRSPASKYRQQNADCIIFPYRALCDYKITSFQFFLSCH